MAQTYETHGLPFQYIITGTVRRRCGASSPCSEVSLYILPKVLLGIRMPSDVDKSKTSSSSLYNYTLRFLDHVSRSCRHSERAAVGVLTSINLNVYTKCTGDEK